MLDVGYYTSPIGTVEIKSSNRGITSISYFSGDKIKGNSRGICSNIDKAITQLDEFFNKKRQVFDIPLDIGGTQFQHSIWQEISKIPFGKTDSYKNIAGFVGNPKAARAVGMACNKNPILIIIPCHRVVASNGNMQGYALGLEKKEWLLQLENSIYNRRI